MTQNLIELELLSNLVADYSEEHFAIGTPSLADVMKLRMYEMHLTQRGLAAMLNISPSRVSAIVSGKTEPTYKVAQDNQPKTEYRREYSAGCLLMVIEQKHIDLFNSWRADWNKFVRDVLHARLDREQQAIITSIQTQSDDRLLRVGQLVVRTLLPPAARYASCT